MRKLAVVGLAVLGLALLLVGGTVGCGGGGTAPGGLSTFLANFLPAEIRVDQSMPAAVGRTQLPVACCSGATVYVVWEDYRNGESDLFFNRSTNGGVSWQASNTRIDTGTPAGTVRAVRPSICCEGSNLYVAWAEEQESGLFNYYFNRSTDGGTTWLPNRIKIDASPNPLPTTSNPKICCCNDTVIVTWSDARTGDEQVYVSRSTDAGLTWNEQRIGGVATFHARNPLCCCEQVGMVQYVYVAWIDERLGGQRVFFDRSTNGGQTWGADANLDSSASFFVSDICCDGMYVYVAWLGSGGARTRMRGSSDFGATFNAEQNLKTAAGGSGFSPRICCEGATVRAVFTDSTGGQQDVYYNTSTDAGVTILAAQVRVDNGAATDESSSPFICCNGNTLVCIFIDDRSGTFDVWTSRSIDGGTTWSADVRLDVAGGAVATQNITTCCDGANLYAAYTDERDGPNRAQVQINGSSNAGANWFANDVRVSQPNPPGLNATTSDACFVAKGNTVHAVFADRRLGEYRVFYNRSTDGGTTWMPSDVLLDAGVTDSADRAPVICCSGNNVYVAWERDYEMTSNEDVYVNRSNDGGLSWQGAATRVNLGVAADSTSTGQPVLCCSGNNVVVAWHDNRGGDNDIFINRSSNGGGTWLAMAQRVDNAPAAINSENVDICCQSSRVHLAWEDQRDGNKDIYTNRSLDGGVNWQGADTRLDVTDAAGANWSYDPILCCHGNRVYVAFEDDRDGDEDVYVAASGDAGANYSPDQRINLGTAPGVGEASDIAICCEDARVYVAYADDRNGDEDIYFNRSLDGGATWLPADIRIDIGDAPGADESDDVAICCNGDRVYISWDEDNPAIEGPNFTASIDAGTTWMPAPILISADIQPRGGSQKIACTPNFVYVLWVHSTYGPQDAVINRTPP